MIVVLVQVLLLWVFSFINFFANQDGVFKFHPVLLVFAFSLQNVTSQFITAKNRHNRTPYHIFAGVSSTVATLAGSSVIFLLKGGFSRPLAEHIVSWHSWMGLAAVVVALTHGTAASLFLWPGLIASVAPRRTRLALHRITALLVIWAFAAALILGFAKVLGQFSVQTAVGAALVVSIAGSTTVKTIKG
jgi:hypothetical protein